MVDEGSTGTGSGEKRCWCKRKGLQEHEEDITMKRRSGPSVNAVVVVVCSCWPKEGDSVNAVVVVVCFCWPKEGDSVNTVVVAACSCWPKQDLGGGQRVSAVVAAVCSCWPEEEEVTV